MKVIIEEYVDDFEDLKDMCWSGALDVLNDIEEKHQQDIAMEIIEDYFSGEFSTPTTTQLNDFVWFDLEDCMEENDEN